MPTISGYERVASQEEQAASRSVNGGGGYGACEDVEAASYPVPPSVTVVAPQHTSSSRRLSWSRCVLGGRRRRAQRAARLMMMMIASGSESPAPLPSAAAGC